MKIKITVALCTGPVLDRGNVYSKVIEIDDEDLEALTQPECDQRITDQAAEYVLFSMVGWDWEKATE